MNVEWKTQWYGEHGTGRVEVAQYQGHTLVVREWGANHVALVDGELLPNTDRREGAKMFGAASHAQAHAVAWVDGKVKKHGPRTLLEPEGGFFYYQTHQKVAVSQIADGKFKVEVEDPFASRRATKSKIFRAGQHEAAAQWAAKQVAAHMTRSIAAFHTTRRGSGEPEPEPDRSYDYDPWADDDYARF